MPHVRASYAYDYHMPTTKYNTNTSSVSNEPVNYFQIITATTKHETTTYREIIATKALRNF